MSLVITVPMLLIVLGIAGVAVPRRGRVARAVASRCPGLAPVWNRVLLVRFVALVLGLAIASYTAGTGELGQGAVLAPATLGVVLIAGVLCADLVVRATAFRAHPDVVPEPNHAGIGAYLPRATTSFVVVGAVATAAFLTWSTAVASPDDMGRVGRAFAVNSGGGVGGAFGPFPGSFYTGPIAGGMLLLAALLVTTLMVVMRRMHTADTAERLATDQVLRVRTAEGALAGAGVAVGATLAGTAGIVAAGFSGRASTGALDPALEAAMWVALALTYVGLALTIWSLVVYFLPGSVRESAVAG